MANLKSPVREKYASDLSYTKTPPRWKRPDEVMRLHKLRAKHNALQARMNKTQLYGNQTSQLNTSVDSVLCQGTEKRKNPFKKSDVLKTCDTSKRIKPQILDESTGNLSVFQLLHYDENTTKDKSTSKLTSFKNIFNQSLESCELKVEPEEVQGFKNISVDWKLRTKARFLSLKPFSWNSKLKTCEEASGTTAFVRCLDSNTNNKDCSLDTSANAQFHQCCLVWQHPVLPWVELYPRHVHTQKNAVSSLFSSQNVRDSMHSAWTESFRSAFQLVRAQQCPYFYVLGNTFTCLFRAAGISGHSEINAMITPTTRGFRQALKLEDIEFTMPLKDSDEKRRSFENHTDTGYSSLDVTTTDENTSAEVMKSKDKDEENDNYGDDEDEDDEEWLQSMGVDENEIKRISNSQSEKEFGKEKQIDKTPESLVYVEGVEAQALFNFLMNCKSNIAVTGPLAGIPPTILSPVAFHGATLRPLKVRQNIVNTGAEQYHSIEIKGPVLPHVVHSVANLLKESLDTFSLTFASIESTAAFSLLHKTKCLSQKTDEKKIASESTSIVNSIAAFGQVNLSDCGLPPTLLQNFCRGDNDSVQSFDSLKYSDNLFTWS